jgi:hypothetical protein
MAVSRSTSQPNESITRGELKPAEVHPVAYHCLTYLQRIFKERPFLSACLSHTYSTTAIESNRIGEVCGETLRRYLKGEALGDRYIIALAWSIKDIIEVLPDVGRMDLPECIPLDSLKVADQFVDPSKAKRRKDDIPDNRKRRRKSDGVDTNEVLPSRPVKRLEYVEQKTELA